MRRRLISLYLRVAGWYHIIKGFIFLKVGYVLLILSNLIRPKCYQENFLTENSNHASLVIDSKLHSNYSKIIKICAGTVSYLTKIFLTVFCFCLFYFLFFGLDISHLPSYTLGWALIILLKHIVEKLKKYF